MTTATYDGSCTALESKADVASLEGLHAQRRALVPEYSRLRALHGPNGKFDVKRKAMLEALKVRARFNATKAGEKITEGYIDALAHGDDQYINFIDGSIEDATRYVILEIEMTEIEERVKDREISLYAYSAETRLGR